MRKDTYDFFLVNVHCRQGVPTPSHYSVLADEIEEGPEKIQELTYKLSYMYYNFSGADRLATMVGERGNAMPHKHYDNIKGLYFI